MLAGASQQRGVAGAGTKGRSLAVAVMERGRAASMPRLWSIALAALAMTSLAGCDVLGAILEVLYIVAIVVMVLLGILATVCAVVLIVNIVFAVKGKGSSGWGAAGLVFGSQALLVSLWGLGLGSSADTMAPSIAGLMTAIALCALGFHNVRRAGELRRLAMEAEAAQPPPPPPQPEPPQPPPKLAPPWP